MKALIRSSLWIQTLLLTAGILTITTSCWFAVCELTMKWLDFSSHTVLAALILVVSLTTSALMLLLVHRKVFRSLRVIEQYNLKQAAECTADDCAVMLIPDELIPEDEIGDVMRSRNMMLDRLAHTLQEVQESYKKIAELEKMKDNLTQMIVHDLKNPLGVMLLGIDVLDKKRNLPDDQKKLLHHARTSGQQMLGMIQNLLDISKMESGKLQLNPSPVDLRTMAAEILETLKANGLAEAKTLTLSVEPDLPIVPADEDLVRRVIQNLLSNALKHTPHGGHIELRITKGENNSLLVAIADDGMGISKEDQARIFDKFEQLGLRDAKQRTGSGLGLTFCKLAVEAHGGKIWVESEQGRGSTFFVQLPVSPESS